MWERTLDIIGIILKVISMAEKIIPGAGNKTNDNNGNIIIVLTPEEYEVFRNDCLGPSILSRDGERQGEEN